MKKFAVFGNPIAQSLSPTIHQMFAQQVGEEISYEKILAPVEGFVDAVEAFLAQEDAVGCNVTIPFKLDAYNFAVVDDVAANDAKAANTLMKKPSGIVSGFNTDGIGLVNDLVNNNVVLKGKSVLLIGAGGAARGVIAPLLAAGVTKLTIANRTIDKAEQVAKEAGEGRVDVVALSDIATLKANIIINSTAASLSGDLPCELSSDVFEQCDAAYDMVYKTEPTAFVVAANSFGATIALDGLGMLVEQAAAAFSIWTGKQPSTKDVIASLRSEMTNK